MARLAKRASQTLGALAVCCMLAGGASGCGSSSDDDSIGPDAGATGATSGDLFDASTTGPGCNKIDMLFMIDNSTSMLPYQQALGEAFPGFVDKIYELLPNKDIHIAITTSSFYVGDTDEGWMDCVTLATPEYIEEKYVPPTESNTGENGGQGRLFDYQGQTFFQTSAVNPASGLKEWFSAAAVAAGESGSSVETQMAAVAYVGDPSNASTNAGFLRDDETLYMIFMLTDEPDKSPEGLEKYKQMVRDEKGECGGDICVLMAGLVQPCVIAGQSQLAEFLGGFGKPAVLGSILEPDKYTEVVGDGLAKAIEHACADVPGPE
jgi:hypothetical protein